MFIQIVLSSINIGVDLSILQCWIFGYGSKTGGKGSSQSGCSIVDHMLKPLGPPALTLGRHLNKDDQ
jgi:hypothetical protein